MLRTSVCCNPLSGWIPCIVGPHDVEFLRLQLNGLGFFGGVCAKDLSRISMHLPCFRVSSAFIQFVMMELQRTRTPM